MPDNTKAKKIVHDLSGRYPFVFSRLKKDALVMQLKPFILKYLGHQDKVEEGLSRKVTQKQMMKILKTGYEMAHAGEI